MTTCTPGSVLAEAEQRKKANPDAKAQQNATAFHANYCEILQHGAQIVELAKQPIPTNQTAQPLVALGRATLRPPSEADFRARGDAFIAKAAVCSKQAAGPPTPRSNPR